MNTWMSRANGTGATAGQGQDSRDNQLQRTPSSPRYCTLPTARIRDPNAPDHRLELNSKCIYERSLPGRAYITCHVDRLQSGFYDSASIHESSIEHVRFVALHFVFHPTSTINRFTAATIRISVRNNALYQTGYMSSAGSSSYADAQEKKHSRQNPSVLRHAPHLLYGSISPETLQWNFNLAGSLGVSQAPLSANLSPSGGLRGSYKLFEMMKIQGSSRTYRGRMGPDDDVEDGEIVWTLEENRLQKSGLPREFTFIILLQKGDPELDTMFGIEIDPVVSNWLGHYPSWYLSLPLYQPLLKPHLNLDHEIGQRFEPTVPGRGYNFANITCSFENFVALPGTTYSTSDNPGISGPGHQKTDSTQTPIATSLQNSLVLGAARPHGHDYQTGQGQCFQPRTQQPEYQIRPNMPQNAPPSLFPDNTLNVRVFFENRTPSPKPAVSVRSGLLHTPRQTRQHSLRRSRSRDGLISEYDAHQHELSSPVSRTRSNGAARRPMNKLR